MTETELKDLWSRWMHRNDIMADLDTVFLMASSRVAERVLVSSDIPDILANNPRMLVHAGLIYLHELAQDDDGVQREERFFREAVVDYGIYKSRKDRPTIDPYSYRKGA